jgi:dihydroneopterin aldolase
MDRIFISALSTEAVIGIYDWERGVKQRLEIDLEMWVDLRAAGRSDAIDDTLNYKSVAKRVLALVEGSSYRLVRRSPARSRASYSRSSRWRAFGSASTSPVQSATRAMSAS